MEKPSESNYEITLKLWLWKVNKLLSAIVIEVEFCINVVSIKVMFGAIVDNGYERCSRHITCQEGKEDYK